MAEVKRGRVEGGKVEKPYSTIKNNKMIILKKFHGGEFSTQGFHAGA